MRKLLTGIVLLMVFASCENKNKKQGSDIPVDVPVDTVSNVVAGDFEETDNPEPFSETPEIIRNESFDDFIYNFATDGDFQRKRVIFPLPVYDQDTPLKIEKDDWETDESFAGINYYTLIFDKEEDMELAVDTSLNSIRIEWIYMIEEKIKKYYFERIKGQWMLEAINLRDLEQEDSKDFIDFFHRFATDSLYQSEHICSPLPFVTIDPDDDFAILESTLDPNQWFAFKPVLPDKRLSNINYGQANTEKSRTKILELKGIGYGFSNILHFIQRNGKWKLCKYEDTSN